MTSQEQDFLARYRKLQEERKQYFYTFAELAQYFYDQGVRKYNKYGIEFERDRTLTMLVRGFYNSTNGQVRGARKLECIKLSSELYVTKVEAERRLRLELKVQQKRLRTRYARFREASKSRKKRGDA